MRQCGFSWVRKQRPFFLLLGTYLFCLSWFFCLILTTKEGSEQTNKWTQTPQNTLYMEIYLNLQGTIFHSLYCTFQIWLLCKSTSISSSDYISPNWQPGLKCNYRTRLKLISNTHQKSLHIELTFNHIFKNIFLCRTRFNERSFDF